MKKITILFLLTFSINIVAHAQQSTEVYLFDLTKTESGFELTNPVNASDNEGYDNQPSFTKDGKALLFASKEPLSAQELHERVAEDVDVGACLLALKEDYSERGIHLIEMDGRWAFRTAVDLADALSVEKEEKKKRTRTRQAMKDSAKKSHLETVSKQKKPLKTDFLSFIFG